MSRAKRNWDFLVRPDGTYPESISNLKGQKGVKGGVGPKGVIGEKGDIGPEGQVPAAAVTAHVNFNGDTANGVLTPSDIFAQYGIASVEKLGTGNYVVTYDTAFYWKPGLHGSMYTRIRRNRHFDWCQCNHCSSNCYNHRNYRRTW